MSGSHLTDEAGRTIHVPGDLRRVDGLVAEDKVRTLTLFRPGNYAEHPTAPIDIAPLHDLVQGLGTHVKSFVRARDARRNNGKSGGTLELASTLELMRLSGHHRYIALIYEIDGHIVIDGKRYDVRRYHTAIEMIFSPTTFAAIRGSYTLEHLAWMQRRLDAIKLTDENINEQQARFKNLMGQFRKHFGIATQSAKLSMDKKKDREGNKRVQTALSLKRLQAQLETESDYHGRITQPNYREWHEGETFHGLRLPWYTIAKDRIFGPVGDPDAELDEAAKREMAKRQADRAARRIVAPPATPVADRPLSTAMLAFDRGMVVIARHADGRRMITIDGVDADALDEANAACRRLGGVETISGWQGDLAFARRVVEHLQAGDPIALPAPEPDHVDALPDVPEVNPLRQSRTNPNHYSFLVEGHMAAAHRMKTNWVLMPQDSALVAAIFDEACGPHAPQKPWDGNHKGDWKVRYNAERGSWLVRDKPVELIQQVVRAIQEHRR